MHLPGDFIHRMQSQLGEEWPAFETALQSPPPISIRLNPLKDFKWRENYEGVKWCSKGVYLPERPVFTLDPAFHAGAYYVQEASSMFLAEVIRQLRPAGDYLRVLDLCGAPGGKATLLSDILPPDSLVLSNEAIRSRYQILRENLDKWGHARMQSSQLEVDRMGGLKGFFDIVLVDAPCSGEGLFRKDPRAREAWSEQNVAICSARQKRILAGAAPLVREGGLLVYSTCTYNREENEGNAEWLAEQFQLSTLSLELPAEWNIAQPGRGYQFYPHRVRGEGLYVAAFRLERGEPFRGIKMKSGAPNGWKAAPKSFAQRMPTYLEHPDGYVFWESEKGTIHALPASQARDSLQLTAQIRLQHAGLTLGQVKKNDFVPSPQLALSTALRPDFPRIELDRETALSYLRRDPISVGAQPQGWHLVAYENLPLGWIKVLPKRVNNYFPKAWRIRMAVGS